jgi:hypothetical protein
VDPGAPPNDVLRAFGGTDAPVRMGGGQRQAYRAGQVVPKPAQDD